MACMAAKPRTATGQPTTVRSTIHTVAGASQLTLTRALSAARRPGPVVSSSTHTAMPTRPRGQKPHGGSDAASSSPAATARSQGRPSVSSLALPSLSLVPLLPRGLAACAAIAVLTL